MKPSFRPPTELTVAEYYDRFQKVESADIDPRRVRGWVAYAPPVEALLRDGYQANEGWIRVFNPEAYDLQMRRLLGIL